jgi:hypothetical protein
MSEDEYEAKHTKRVSESSETKVSEAGDGAGCSRSRASSSTGGKVLTRMPRSRSDCMCPNGPRGREGATPMPPPQMRLTLAAASNKPGVFDVIQRVSGDCCPMA